MVSWRQPGSGADPIYLDYNATTPLDPGVLEAMLPYLAEHFGNPSSGHIFGRRTHAAVENARDQVADLLGCDPAEVVFTGGGSEANNLAIKGVALARREVGDHIITSRIEHPAVLNTCRYLAARLGFRITELPVDGTGLVDPNDLERALTPRTVLVTVMQANNEIGTIEPIRELDGICRERGILFHTDAAQSVGKVPVNVGELDVDLLTVAGHKLYAPKGIGALYVRRGVSLDPLIHGAGHEQGRRAGTENVAGIVALGAAAAIARRGLPEDEPRLRGLRDRLQAKLEAAGWVLNGHPERRLPNTLNLSCTGTDGEELLARTPEIAASTGSACHAGRTEPSAVLMALGLDRARALGAVRLSLGRWTTEAEVDRAAHVLMTAARSS